MKVEVLEFLRCPYSRQRLKMVEIELRDQEIIWMNDIEVLKVGHLVVRGKK